jgi:hypothetical protein
MILTIILGVVGGIEFLFAILTHGVALSFNTSVCRSFWSRVIIRKIDNGGWSG